MPRCRRRRHRRPNRPCPSRRRAKSAARLVPSTRGASKRHVRQARCHLPASTMRSSEAPKMKTLCRPSVSARRRVMAPIASSTSGSSSSFAAEWGMCSFGTTDSSAPPRQPCRGGCSSHRCAQPGSRCSRLRPTCRTAHRVQGRNAKALAGRGCPVPPEMARRGLCSRRRARHPLCHAGGRRTCTSDANASKRQLPRWAGRPHENAR